MNDRTVRTEVRFRSAFLLPELDAPLPAGTYRIDTDETLIGGMERSVYLRTATLLFVEGAGTTRVVTVAPESLESALALDAANDQEGEISQ